MLILLFLFIISYMPVFAWMYDRWTLPDSSYSHGLLVPLISFYLIWQKRYLFSNYFEPSVWGKWVFLSSIFLHVLGMVLGVYFISGFSMIGVLAGFVLSIWGNRVFKELLFPLVFLIFMVPLPLAFLINFSFQLKILSTSISVYLLNFLFHSVQQGSYIYMPHGYVVVEDVCSGLRSLIAIISFASLLTYQLRLPFSKGIILLACAVPITVASNSLRIVLLALVMESQGKIPLFLHDVLGFLMFFIAMIGIFMVEKILTKMSYA